MRLLFVSEETCSDNKPAGNQKNKPAYNTSL